MMESMKIVKQQISKNLKWRKRDKAFHWDLEFPEVFQRKKLV